MEEDINNHAKKTCNHFTHIVRLKVTQILSHISRDIVLFMSLIQVIKLPLTTCSESVIFKVSVTGLDQTSSSSLKSSIIKSIYFKSRS